MKSKIYQLVLTTTEPISHHDPAMGKTGNVLTFNRQKQFVCRDWVESPVYRNLVDAVKSTNKMPESIAGIVSRLNVPEWLAVAYVRQFLDIYNKGDGLLDGMERYSMMENRLRTSAIQCHTLHRMWSILVDELQLPMHSARCDAAISVFYPLPPSLQYQMLDIMAEQSRTITTLARLWHATNKRQTEEYCTKSNVPFLPEQMIEWEYDDSDIPEPEKQIVLDIPAISVNSIRHQMLREPLYLHLCDALNIESMPQGHGDLAIGMTSIFYNGGNIQKGAKSPNGAFYLAGQIRQAFPSLDLLGGTTSSFDLGESVVKVSAWIVCKENLGCLPESLQKTPQANTSIFAMMDSITRTRHATSDGEGQMIYNYETLVKGSQIFVEIILTPYAQGLTEGALATAISYYDHNMNIVGGQSARGHGHVQVAWLTEPPTGQAEYKAYMAENKDRLREGVMDGTLCSDKKVIK